jgi:hypothetical protein
VGLSFDPSQISRLVSKIRLVGELARASISEEMMKGAERIVQRARDYAPYDEGKLEDAIKWKKGSERVQARNALGHFSTGTQKSAIAVVYVDKNMPGSGSAQNVGEYAFLMHEEMAPYGEINRGVKTRAKGPQAGGKYLERAIRDETALLATNIKKAASRAMRK